MSVGYPRANGLGRRQIGLLAIGALVIVAVLALVAAFPGGDPFAVLMPAYGAITYTFVGVTVLWRRPGHGIGRLALGIGLVFAVGGLVTLIGSRRLEGLDLTGLPTPIPSILEGFMNASAALPTIALVLGVSLLVAWFPDGRRTSALGGLVEVALVASILLVAASSAGVLPIGSDVAVVALMASVVLSLVDLIRRYRRADPHRRTQMKLVVGAMVVNVALMAFTLGPGSNDPRFDWAWPVWLISMGLPILAIAIGITRYHLYDIDRIVSRSIAYALVSAIVALVFGAIVVLLSTALASIAQGETIAVAASTLAAFALFQPVLRRVRRGVDMRFDRARYDAERTVAEFSGRLRGEVDIATVAADLDATVHQAVNPVSVRLWIREAGP